MPFPCLVPTRPKSTVAHFRRGGMGGKGRRGNLPSAKTLGRGRGGLPSLYETLRGGGGRGVLLSKKPLPVWLLRRGGHVVRLPCPSGTPCTAEPAQTQNTSTKTTERKSQKTRSIAERLADCNRDFGDKPICTILLCSDRECEHPSGI